VGTHNPLALGEYPTSEESHFSLFGYDYKKDLPGRGVIEALGVNVPLTPSELVLRVNFASVDGSFKVLDPRAGNIKSVKSFCEFIGERKIGPFTFKLYPGLGHRAALVISGAPVSSCIRHHSTIIGDTDPHKAKNHRGGNKVIIPQPLTTTKEAKQTAEALWEYQKLTFKLLDNYLENNVRKRSGLLPANFLLTRGAGFIKPVKSFYQKYHLRAVCVAGAPLYKGVGHYFGMDVVDVPGATGGFDTDIKAKVRVALEKLNSGYDFAFLHLKGTDVVAEEEGDFEKKINFLERADEAFAPLLDFSGLIMITGDHATPCILKDHSEDAVPLLISGEGKDKVAQFNEKVATQGSLGHIMGWELMGELLERAKKGAPKC
jgi:2,3-bisphosphoglycerate-independent phosphoglycerate mutase